MFKIFDKSNPLIEDQKKPDEPQVAIVPQEQIHAQALNQTAEKVASSLGDATGNEHTPISVVSPHEQVAFGDTKHSNGSTIPVIQVVGEKVEVKQEETPEPIRSSPSVISHITDAFDPVVRDAQHTLSSINETGLLDRGLYITDAQKVGGLDLVKGRVTSMVQPTGGRVEIKTNEKKAV